MRQLPSYEIVAPVRVDERGAPLPRAQPFRRRRRSAEPPPGPAARYHFQLAAYGQLFRLNLSADAGFLAPGFAVLHRGRPPPAPPPPPPDLRHCFYRGTVNARDAHAAVLSLCGGLVSETPLPPSTFPSAAGCPGTRVASSG